MDCGDGHVRLCRRRACVRILADPGRGQGAGRSRLRGQRGIARVLVGRRTRELVRVRRRLLPRARGRHFRRPEQGAARSAVRRRALPGAQDGKIDVLSRNSTWTMGRETEFGLTFVGVTYYDGQGFMLPRAMHVSSALELDGAKVCVQSGTTTIDNLADFFASNRMSLQEVVSSSTDELDQELRRRPLLRPHQRSLPALRPAPAPRQAARPCHPARRDLEGAARAGGAAERSAMDRDREMGPFRHDQRRGARRQLAHHRSGPAIAEARGHAPRRHDRRLRRGDRPHQRLGGEHHPDGRQLRRGVRPQSRRRKSPLAIPRGLNQLWNAGGIQYAPPIWGLHPVDASASRVEFSARRQELDASAEKCVKSSSMRCYFLKAGHIEAVEELPGLSDDEAVTKRASCFSERSHLFDGFEVWDRTQVIVGTRPSIRAARPRLGFARHIVHLPCPPSAL